MKRLNLKIWVVSIVFVGLIGAGALTIAAPVETHATSSDSCSSGFLSFPSWYRGLTNSDCTLESPGDGKGQVSLSDYIWHIALNIIDIGLQAVGYITAFFILYGGFLFLTSSGEAANIAKAKTTILNAVIGLVISIVSIAIVNLIFGIIN
jgi:hypothetical protein